MLSVINLTCPEDRSQVLENFNPFTSSWIVPDLCSKITIQDKLLKKFSGIDEIAVLRASELWKLLLPQYQFISASFAETLIRDEFDPHATLILSYISQLMPLLSHPQGPEALEAWFCEHPASFNEWGDWYAKSYQCWNYFQKNQILLPHWAKGFLINEFNFEQHLKRDLIFELSGELYPLEMELIIHLSRVLSVTLLRPLPSWIEDFKKIDKNYASLNEKSLTNESKLECLQINHCKKNHDDHLYYKWPTMLSEVKNSVALVREWLENGIPLSQITITAPQIDLYLPVLEPYLEQEGIITRRRTTLRASTFPGVIQWISRLKIKSNQINFTHLSTDLFCRERKIDLSYDYFYSLYYHIDEKMSLNLSQDVNEHYLLKEPTAHHFTPNEKISKDEFLHWACNEIPSEHEIFLQIIKKFNQESLHHHNLPVSLWIEYLESIITQLEISKDLQSNELACVNLLSAQNFEASHLIVLGLSEKELNTGSKNPLPFKDVFNIEKEMGFLLESIDTKRNEFALRWLLESSRKKVILNYSATNFMGESQSPSVFWLKGSIKNVPNNQTPLLTRWDEIQRSTPEEIFNLRNIEPLALIRLNEDLSQNFQPFCKNKTFKLSASSIENYLECPFIFASKKIFNLSDNPTLDIDLDRSTLGRLSHCLFKNLVNEPMKFDLSQESLSEIIEQTFKDEKILFLDHRISKSIKMKMFKMAKEFLDFELKWRTQFPKTKTERKEWLLSGFINSETGKFNKDGVGFPFSGYIDRLDSDGENNWVILDYKSSSNSLRQFNSWIKNGEIQLALYSLALEEGLTEFGKIPIVGAFYYILKDHDRDIGFKLVDQSNSLFKIDDKRQNKITQEEKYKFYENVTDVIKNILRGISEGAFTPLPRFENECKKCIWRSLCRKKIV